MTDYKATQTKALLLHIWLSTQIEDAVTITEETHTVEEAETEGTTPPEDEAFINTCLPPPTPLPPLSSPSLTLVMYAKSAEELDIRLSSAGTALITAIRWKICTTR